MKNLLLIFLLFVCTAARGQELAINTTRYVGGDSSCGNTICNYSISTNDGGVLFVGYTTCYSGGADIPPSVSDSLISILGNVMVGKIDSNMNVSWVKVYGGTRLDYAVSAVQTVDGGYAVLAMTESNDHDVSGNHGYAGDYWLIRLDSTGSLLWQKCYGSPYDEQAASIALAPDGGFIFFGASNGAGGDVPMHYSGSEFDYDWFVVKTDDTGHIQWTKTIGGLHDEQPFGSIFYADNGYYLVSSSNSFDHDCHDTAWCAGNGQWTGSNYYIFKLDTSGNILWDSSYGGESSDLAYAAIWDQRDSSIIVNGYTHSHNYMISGNHGDDDISVFKVNKDGVFRWQKCLGSPLEEWGKGIAATPYGYLASGEIRGVGQGVNWIFALDTVGGIITNHQFAGDSIEEISASIDKFKNGYATIGSTSSTAGFSEGTNLGIKTGAMTNVYVSYLDFWPLSITETQVTAQLKMYPNPTSDFINIEGLQGGILSISNIVGEKIYANESYEKSYSLGTHNWQSGMYIVRWQNADGSLITSKFIKN